MEGLGLADRVELIEHVPRRESLRLQRDSDALLLLIPEAGGRGRGVLSGKVFEYLAAERPMLAVVPPDGAAAQLVRDTGAASSRRPTTSTGIRDALARAARAVAGRAGSTARRSRRSGASKLSRATRVEELAELLKGPRVSAASVAGRARRSRARASTGCFLLATLFCVTFEKVHWNLGGDLGVADVLTVLFLLAFALTSRGPVPRTTAIVLGFFAAFLLVYLLGFFNLETKQALDQFTKGMVKFVLHFLFLAASVSYLVRRGAAVLLARARLVQRRLRRELRLRRAAAPVGARPATTSTRRCSRR